jgi:nucleotide-binding universal stress UspA family protein
MVSRDARSTALHASRRLERAIPEGMSPLSASQEPVVVAVDGSSRDVDALRLGGRIAELLAAPIVAAHAHPDERVADLLGDGAHERVLRAVAEQMREDAARHLQGADVTMTLLADRSPARAMHRLAATDRAHMIVVGASERGRVGLIRPGSTSERIIQGSPCPVAVAPAGFGSGERVALESIGCAFDAQPPARAALAEAVRLAKAAGVRLQVMAVFEPITFGHLPVAPPLDLRTVNASIRSSLERQLDDAVAGVRGVETEPVLLDGDAGERLSEQTESLDLLVVGSRGYGPLRSVLLGGVSGQVIRRARCPVVVCPANEHSDDPPASGTDLDRVAHE